MEHTKGASDSFLKYVLAVSFNGFYSLNVFGKWYYLLGDSRELNIGFGFKLLMWRDKPGFGLTIEGVSPMTVAGMTPSWKGILLGL